MATRRERVVLELDDQFTREMARAAAAAALFDRELNGINTRSGPALSRTAVTIERDTGRAGASIDKLSGRLALLAQSGAALGPALIPVLTAAAPAIAGLTAEAGFAVIAGGSMALAFKGVADTLQALNKAQLDPSAANIKKVREEASKLSPVARDLVVQLDEMGPAFNRVRKAAAEGLLPGISGALDEIEGLLPRIADITREVGDATGSLVERGAANLAGPEWEDFFTFIETNARPTLTELGETIGHVTKGLAEMWMAFDPLADDFTGGLLEASAAFEDWAEGLGQTEDFRAFVTYVRETGPVVLETLGDIGNAFLQIAEAAAPLGGPTLEILGAIADTIAAVADSDLGTPIMAGVAALSAMNLILHVTEKTAGTAFGGMVKGQVQASAGIRTLRTDLALMRAEYERTGRASAVLTSALSDTTPAAHRARQSLAQLGKGAGLAVGGLVVMESGLAETKAATFALTGALLGGAPGAVAGGLVGGILDFTSVSKNADKTTRAWSRSFRDANGDILAMADTVDLARTHVTDLLDDLHSETGAEFLKNIFDPDVWDVGFHEIFGGQSAFAKEAAAADDLEERLGDVRLAARQFTEGQDLSDEALTASLLRVRPAMDALGISLDDLIQGARDGSIVELSGSIETWMIRADTAAGRTDALAETIAALGDESVTTAEKTDLLTTALDALFDPQLNLSEATDKWREGLRNFREDLDTMIREGHSVKGGKDVPDLEVPGSRKVFGDTEGAAQNRDVIRDRIGLIKELLAAEVDAGASKERIARLFRSQRDALLDVAEAAGLSRDEVDKYIRKLGFTPKAIRTVIDAVGLPQVETAVDRLNAKLDRLARRRVVKVTAGAIMSGDRFGVSATDRDGDGKPDWATGGYTGRGGKYEPAGIVHRGEVVIPAEETARDWNMLKGRYGYLPGFADGGVAGRSVAMASWSGGMSDRDIDRIVAGLATVRATYGTAYITPHNYDDFKRIESNDRALAGSDRVRR